MFVWLTALRGTSRRHRCGNGDFHKIRLATRRSTFCWVHGPLDAHYVRTLTTRGEVYLGWVGRWLGDEETEGASQG